MYKRQILTAGGVTPEPTAQVQPTATTEVAKPTAPAPAAGFAVMPGGELEKALTGAYKGKTVTVDGPFTNPDGTVTNKYLVKWKGLPYCEGTYETMEDMQAGGLAAQVEEFFVSGPGLKCSKLHVLRCEFNLTN